MRRKNSVKLDVGTKHGGHRSQTVRDSNNVIQADISGSENIINLNSSSKSNVFNIGANEVANGYVVLGRLLLKYVGTNKLYAAIIISLISSGYLGIDMFTVKLLPQTTEIYITTLGIFWFISTLFIFGLYGTRTCEKCGQKFAVREISATHLGSGNYRGRIHHNIKSVYKCDFCGHEVVKEFIDVEEVDGI
jgi:hypothetical protein